jgi:Bacteroidetes VLRF1 release factor
VQVPSSVDMVSRLFGMCVCIIGVRCALLTSYQDIRNLLSDWADEIHQCERIWIRASASNRRIFLDYDDAVIVKGKSLWEVSGCAIHEQS